MAGNMTADQCRRYRALMAFQLRGAMMEHADIARVLNVSPAVAGRLVKYGRRLLIDCVVMTVPD